MLFTLVQYNFVIMCRIREFDFICTILMIEMFKNMIEKYHQSSNEWDDIVPVIVHPRYEIHTETD